MNFKILIKYINRIFITVLVVCLALRLHLDLTTDGHFIPGDTYRLLLLLILIFCNDNIVLWVLSLIIGIYALQELYMVSPYAAESTRMEFSTDLFRFHLKSKNLRMYSVIYFPYVFYISMMIYSSLMIVFKLYQLGNPPKDKKQDL